MTSLLYKLEQATEGSRELDGEIFCAVLHPDKTPTRNFFYKNRDEWGVFVSNQPKPGMTFHDAPHYTTSLDDALTLVEGWDHLVIKQDPSGIGVEVGNWRLTPEPHLTAFGKCAHTSIPLAICCASLKARE